MTGRSYRVGRLAGIPVGVSPLWLVIVGLITWSLGSSYYPDRIHGISAPAAYALGLASALLLFASILAHEFGHALVARRRGVEIEEIDLWLLGGVSRMKGEAHAPDDELLFAAAGPAVTAVIAAVFGALWLALPGGAPAAIKALVEYQLIVNVAILGFNLIPAFPLDGGRIARAVMWRRSGDMRRATEVATRVGRGFGYVLVALGFLEVAAGSAYGLWLALVGIFLIMAAGAQSAQASLVAALSGVSAGDIMSEPVICIPGQTSLNEAATAYFMRYGYTAFPIVDATGRFTGLLTISALERTPPATRAHTRTADAAIGDAQLMIGERDDVAKLLERPAFTRVGRAVVVDADRIPIGLLSITDVQRSLRARRLLGQTHAVAS